MPVLKLPIASIGITLTEIPDKVAVYLEIGNCKNNCAGCHSDHLRKPMASNMTIADIEAIVERNVNNGANACVIMGGDNNGLDSEDLECLIKTLSYIVPTGIYVGDSDAIKYAKMGAKWVKTGKYVEALGGLDKPATNQHFYEVITVASTVVATSNLSVFSYKFDYFLKDKTDLFRK